MYPVGVAQQGRATCKPIGRVRAQALTLCLYRTGVEAASTLPEIKASGFGAGFRGGGAKESIDQLMDGEPDEMIDELAAESVDGEEGGLIDELADQSMIEEVDKIAHNDLQPEEVDELADETMVDGSVEPLHTVPQVRKPCIMTYGERGNRPVGRRNPIDDDNVAMPSRADTTISKAANRVDRREKQAWQEEVECQVDDSNEKVAHVSGAKPTSSHISTGADHSDSEAEDNSDDTYPS